MKRSHRVRFASAFALILPLAAFVATAQQPVASDQERIVTEADHGSAVTLNAGEVLVVRLQDNPSTGYSRALVSFPNMPVRLVSQQMLAQAPVNADGAPVVGAPRVSEWRFIATGEAAFGRTVWLKLLRQRPFAQGVDTAGLWEIKVTIPKSQAQ